MYVRDQVVIEQLRRIHDGSWDPARRLVRLAPGTNPGLDLSPFALHVVRETALGAYLDLGDGRVERAVQALEAVLNHQYDEPGRPWHGTFRVTAEQADPPGDEALEWYHYDPNWRQFLGTILVLCVEDFGHLLDRRLQERMVDAVRTAVEGEPEDRIPPWYTNPNLMQAWLQGWTGRRVGDDRLLRRGVARARLIADRLDRYGDLDEYNSPTYDGIDLYAAALWTAMPPTAVFDEIGRRIVATVAERLSTLYHRELGAICGPYIRAYGLDLRRYVSQAAMWLLLAGEPADRVLPAMLDQHTVHVHDLYFLPLFARLAGEVVPSLDLRTDHPRSHEQHFDGVEAASIVAESRLHDGVALGTERGRRPELAADQYVPVTVHTRDADGSACWLGMKLGPVTTSIDATPTGESGAAVSVRSEGSPGTDLVLVGSQAPTWRGSTATLGNIELVFAHAPVAVETVSGPSGEIITVSFAGSTVDLALSVRTI